MMILPKQIMTALVAQFFFFFVAAFGQQCTGVAVSIDASIAMIGGQVTIAWEEPGSPLAPTVLVISDGLGPTTITGFGTVCLDTDSSALRAAYVGHLDSNGRASVSASIPPYVNLAALPPSYFLSVVISAQGPLVSTTERFEFENADSYKATQNPLSTPRVFHSAVALSTTASSLERRVLISGGGSASGFGLNAYLTSPATNSTDLFDPRARSFSPGPLMSLPRVHHQSVLLADGRVLICGGKDTAGVVTNSCEIFDPATDAFLPTQGMIESRAGHAATRLNDGRVLVTGGLGTFVGATWNNTTQTAACFATRRSSGEIFDPVTGTWSPAANAMVDGKIMHTQTLLLDGRVLIVGGLGYFFWPFPFTNTHGFVNIANCELFDPVTNTFIPTAALPGLNPGIGGGRYGPGVSLLSDGNVFVTGGLGGAAYTALNQLYVTSGNYWVIVGFLEGANEVGRGFHQQAVLADGRVQVFGGYRGPNLGFGFPSETVIEFGAGPQAFVAPIGTNPGIAGASILPVAGHSLTELCDGTYLIAGGVTGFYVIGASNSPYATDQARVYIP